MRDKASRDGRRAPGPPRQQPGELVRPRLVELTARRFTVPVTVVVAGAGCGKSTLLAQAIAANRTAPRGTDAWVACLPDDGDAAHLAGAIVAALTAAIVADPSADAVVREPVGAVLNALGRHAPVDVCLTIDDVGEVPPGSTGAELLADVTARLPPHAHIVFAGRRQPPVPLARRRAASEVLDIGVDDLMFTADEVAALARLAGRAPAPSRLARLDGWPSLVRLALSAPDAAASRSVWDEVVARLDPVQRRALVALATLGAGSPADVARVAGERDVDLEQLGAEVPLIHRDADDRFSAHQLWETEIERIFPATARDPPRRRALALFGERGETQRAGWAALRWGDADAVRAAALRLVAETLGAVPIDTAERWIAGAPVDARRSPELRLLELALHHALHPADRRLVDDIVELADELEDTVGRPTALTALALAALAAHSSGDADRMARIVARIAALDGADAGPVGRFVSGSATAALASLHGDVDGALRALTALDYDQVPVAVTEFVTRLHCAKLCLAGRADEAVVVSRPLDRSPSAYVRTVPGFVRWLAGDPSAYTGTLDPEPGPDTNARWHLYHAMETTLVAASLGDTATIDKLRPTLDRFAASQPDSRDATLIAVATAAGHVADRDDAAAARAIRRHVDDHAESDRLADVHLRWALAIAYVCDERLRSRWHRCRLGAVHERQRQVAEALLAARCGTLDAARPLPPAPVVLTCLPLPWSVELACRATAAGATGGPLLAHGLADLAGEAVRVELGVAAEHADAPTRRGAHHLLASLPDPSQPAVRIGVLGALEIVVGGEVVSGEDIRGRVRVLLEVLALCGNVRRDRLLELMWPDLEPAAAGRNLRVTLSRLRSVIEPHGDRARRPALEANRESIGLARPPWVDVDLWQFRDDVAEADAAERAGDAASQLAALTRACGRWRGAPLPDLDGTAVLHAEVAAVRRAVVSATLRLGELLLVGGRFDEAAGCAARVRARSPFDQRAMRLALAVDLQRGDTSGIRNTVAAATASFAALDIEPDPMTLMLLNQARARLER